MKHLLKKFLLGLLLVSTSVTADESAIRKSLQQVMPGVKIKSIQASEVKGLYEVSIGSDIFYVSDDGKYLLQGHLVDVNARKDLTEGKLATLKKQALNDLGEDQMIIFKPENSKHTVSIFTDIDCGYCRKLHSEIDKYMDQGITIRYLFYPRAGKGSESYKKAVSVWCADDRQKALTEAKQGKTPEEKTCENPVDRHMKLGQDFGARGTPMIVTEKGNVLPGYVPAKQLKKILDSE